jgi:hypothetical protein
LATCFSEIIVSCASPTLSNQDSDRALELDFQSTRGQRHLQLSDFEDADIALEPDVAILGRISGLYRGQYRVWNKPLDSALAQT